MFIRNDYVVSDAVQCTINSRHLFGSVTWKFHGLSQVTKIMLNTISMMMIIIFKFSAYICLIDAVWNICLCLVSGVDLKYPQFIWTTWLFQSVWDPFVLFSVADKLDKKRSSAGSPEWKQGKSKRVRTIFTPEQLERLEAEFERQQYMVGTER